MLHYIYLHTISSSVRMGALVQNIISASVVIDVHAVSIDIVAVENSSIMRDIVTPSSDVNF